MKALLKRFRTGLGKKIRAKLLKIIGEVRCKTCVILVSNSISQAGDLMDPEAFVSFHGLPKQALNMAKHLLMI